MSDLIVKLRNEYDEINPTSSFEYWLAYRIFELQAQVDALNSPVLKSEWQELQAQLDAVRNIPEKAKEPEASPYQKGWIAGWNGFRDELEAALDKGYE